MKFGGDDLRKIRESLRQAFPAATKRFDLVVANADIDIDFAEFEGPSYEIRIHNLLQHAVGQYRLTKLLKAAVDEAPDNPELAEIAGFVDKYFVFLPRFLSEEDDTMALGDAERLLFTNIEFQNVRVWLEKFDRLTRVVCRIEPQPRAEGIGGYGSGFLVSPDVILTNDHVASGVDGKSGFWGKPDRAARVRIRFDCEYTAAGKSTDGKEYKLAADFEVLRSPVDQLDFALLKLDVSEGKPGDDIASGKPRGFVAPVAHQFEDFEPLLILQHPQAEPMKLALGSVTSKVNWPSARVEYAVNTDAGSSGSPCLTQELEVAALHHWGSAKVNRGVLMSAILAHWKKPENTDRLVAAGLGDLTGAHECAAEPVRPDVGDLGPQQQPPPERSDATIPQPAGRPSLLRRWAWNATFLSVLAAILYLGHATCFDPPTFPRRINASVSTCVAILTVLAVAVASRVYPQMPQVLRRFVVVGLAAGFLSSSIAYSWIFVKYTIDLKGGHCYREVVGMNWELNEYGRSKLERDNWTMDDLLLNTDRMDAVFTHQSLAVTNLWLTLCWVLSVASLTALLSLAIEFPSKTTNPQAGLAH
jgi:V8-like Glu-specific endopeptidase